MQKATEESIFNSDYKLEFQNQIELAEVPLKAVIRKLVKSNDEIGTYQDLLKQLKSVIIPEEYKTQVWEVTFHHMITIIKDLLESWQMEAADLESIGSVETVDEFINVLDILKYEPLTDPTEIYSKNYELCLYNLEILQKAGIIWYHKKKLSPVFWEKDAIEFFESINDSFKNSFYLDYWSDADLFLSIKQIPHGDEDNDFWNSFKNSKKSVYKPMYLSVR